MKDTQLLHVVRWLFFFWLIHPLPFTAVFFSVSRLEGRQTRSRGLWSNYFSSDLLVHGQRRQHVALLLVCRPGPLRGLKGAKKHTPGIHSGMTMMNGVSKADRMDKVLALRGSAVALITPMKDDADCTVDYAVSPILG